MNLSHAYGVPPEKKQGEAVLKKALDLGITHFDSAALYGFGRNEQLVGPYLKPYRDEIVLVSKCGMRGENGVRTIDGRPGKLREDVESSLKRLQTDVIDLYYLHRFDKGTPVPIEESVGALSRLVEQGKVREIGLSEISASDACTELGIAFVAFSPLARGFLTSADLDPSSFAEKDIRRGMPRFQEPHFTENKKWLPDFRAIADDAGCTPAQLALAWVLQRGENVHVIPGTTSVEHLEEDYRALDINLSSDVVRRVEALINQDTVSGPRYPAPTQAEIDTEEFA
jgi:aryl-alcohol dehydrogenase-like predicted oxidoreductase